MNIFVLDLCPIKAAQFQCDKHVVKMILETAQLLCSVYPKDCAPYKRTHYNHPCSIWTRESLGNYQWLIKHGKALCKEYTKRYNKIHKSQNIIEWCELNIDNLKFPKKRRTDFTQTMPEKYKNEDVTIAYRNYYIGKKLGFATWKTNKPEWLREE